MGVYIILNKTKSTENDLVIKIGCSKNIKNRFKQIKSSFRFNGMQDELELYNIIKTDEEFLNKVLMRVDLSYYK